MSLRVLITNHEMHARAGTEMYVRDISMALKSRGIEVACFTSRVGDVARELVGLGIPFFSNIEETPWKPDLIHGQHALQATVASIRFPDVPMISFCHGPKAWQEEPARTPAVQLWVAVDLACKERLITAGIHEEKIRLLLNFADTRKFLPRGPLPSRPRKALVFSNYAHENNSLKVIRHVCEELQIELDIAGLASGRSADHPEKILPEYDLVFAKARCAIEAMACGCAVVLCDYFGIGQMVASDNYEALRPYNFGYKTMIHPLDCDTLRREIARYDSQDAFKVSQRIRKEADMEKAVDQLIEIYSEALSRWKARQANKDDNPSGFAAAYAQELGSWVRRSQELEIEIKRLLEEKHGLNMEIQRLLEEDSRLLKWKIKKPLKLGAALFAKEVFRGPLRPLQKLFNVNKILPE